MKIAAFEKVWKADGRPALGPDPRAGRKSLALLESELNEIFKDDAVDATRQKLIRSLILLWHDHLDESHTISQDIHTPDGSFLHGIMHRREPDYWNSKYWFGRVGHHPSFPEIGKRAATILQTVNNPSLRETLLMDGDWNPMGFIDTVEHAVRNHDHKQIELLERLQEIESRVLLEKFLQ